MQQGTQTVRHFFHLFSSGQVTQGKMLCSKSGSECNSERIPSKALQGWQPPRPSQEPQRQWKITPRASLQHSEDQTVFVVHCASFLVVHFQDTWSERPRRTLRQRVTGVSLDVHLCISQTLSHPWLRWSCSELHRLTRVSSIP